MINIFKVSIIKYPSIIFAFWLLGKFVIWMCSKFDQYPFIYSLYQTSLNTPISGPFWAAFCVIMFAGLVTALISLVFLLISTTKKEIDDLVRQKKENER